MKQPPSRVLAYLLRRTQFQDGQVHYSLAIEQPVDKPLRNLKSITCEDLDEGFCLVLQNSKNERFQVGTTQNPLPLDMLSNALPVDAFLVNETGDPVDVRRLSAQSRTNE